MLRFPIAFLLFLFLFNCKNEKKVTIESITSEFNKSISKVENLQYDVQNIMKFSSGPTWDNKGFAVIERKFKDSIFGFSFYGIRHDINRASIYNDGIGFHINNETKTFEQEEGGLHFLGSPGGQMIYKDFFKLDEDYKTVEISETENSFVLNYTFKDITKSNLTERKKTVELDKNTYLPKQIKTSSQPDFGEKQYTVFIFNNVKTNENVDKKINNYISDLSVFELIKEEDPKPNPLLNKKLPEIKLSDLFNASEMISVNTNKVTLIDFWEVWCGPCIASFPKVEALKTKFKDDLNIFGVVTEDTDNAKKLVRKKGTTFVNLIGNKTLKETFNVNSWPRYFLVNTDGIIKREYHGFSTEIEKDIEVLLKK